MDFKGLVAIKIRILWGPQYISNTLRFCASYAPSTLLEEIGFERKSN
ncbi:MAG: hypothetical protein LBS83_00725 [Holosporales bacterium]|nr:hypothetical protein [Holosporales bacterium]